MNRKTSAKNKHHFGTRCETKKSQLQTSFENAVNQREREEKSKEARCYLEAGERTGSPPIYCFSHRNRKEKKNIYRGGWIRRAAHKNKNVYVETNVRISVQGLSRSDTCAGARLRVVRLLSIACISVRNSTMVLLCAGWFFWTPPSKQLKT